MDLPKKTMQSDKRILGIPLLTFVIIIIAFCGITYYASTFASENSDLHQKYEVTRGEVLTMKGAYDQMDRKYKICTSNLQANEDSNRELTVNTNKLEASKKEQENKIKECESQVSSLHQFYLNIKVSNVL